MRENLQLIGDNMHREFTTFCASLLILMLCAGSASAQSFQSTVIDLPVSFRSQALGGTVKDDLDLVYDPIELQFVNGIRLYTNLSNLTSGEEELLNGLSDDEFLFGASWRNGKRRTSWTSILVRYQNARSSNPVFLDNNLDGFFETVEDGNFSNIYSAFLDTDFNGLYDIRQLISQEKSNFDYDRRLMFVINNSLRFDRWVAGFRLMVGRSSTENTTAGGFYGSGSGPLIGARVGDPSFLLDFDIFDLNGNYQDFDQSEAGEFVGESKSRFLQAQAAIMKSVRMRYFRRLEWRADVAYLEESTDLTQADTYRGSFQNFDIENTVFLDDYSEMNERQLSITDDARGFALGGSVRSTFNRADERKNDGFWQFRLEWQRLGFDYDFSDETFFTGDDQFFDGADTLLGDFTSASNSQSLSDDHGDGTLNRLNAIATLNIPLGEKVTVGFGASLRRETVDRSTAYSESLAGFTRFDAIDSLSSNDFETTTSLAMQANREYEFTSDIFSFPVGIEYRFRRNLNWSLRFGSIFTYQKTVENEAESITQATPFIATTDFDDGESTLTITDNVYESTSAQTKTGISQTTFVYGLGWTPTENLQVDLLGFLGTVPGTEIIDTEFYKSLRLSFSVKL